MMLEIVEDQARRKDLLDQTAHALPSFYAYVTMGWIRWNKMAPPPGARFEPFLFTGGAGTCVAIFLQCAEAHGCVAHASETATPEHIIAAVRQMRARTPGRAEAFVFVAGDHFSAADRERIVAAAQSLAPSVRWEINPEGTGYNGGVLFPASKRLVLMPRLDNVPAIPYPPNDFYFPGQMIAPP